MLRLYNTLTRRKEEFKPIRENAVTMYSCGPTVYSYAHIGNLRTYIFMDLVRRVLKYDGYRLKGVLNVTDVGHLLSDGDTGEDKMEAAAKKQNLSPLEIADKYTKVFFEDLKKLNIGKPEIIAKATEHIPEMLDYVEKLYDKGYGYETSDGIYFDIEKFKGYGKLSRINLDDQLAGARVGVNDEKHHPADFALWKKAEPNHMQQWETPRWGMGYPGWHIECSAMSRKYLGEVFDIHSGGVDHIPIHHENEIAQNEALSGKQSVNYWLHGEFMLVDNGKMSKSLGNVYTVADLEARGYDPLDFRFFCLNTHYRKKLNFTFPSLDTAKISRERLNAQILAHKDGTAKLSEEKLSEYKNRFQEAIDDDLNVPLVLGILFTMLKEEKSKDVYNLSLEFDKVLGLSFDKIAPAPQKKPQNADVPDEVRALAEERAAAKKAKNFALADELRGKVTALGYQIIDTKDGAVIQKL